MHYYSSADEPFYGAPTYLLCPPPHFNFMELKWGPKRKVGAQKNFSGALAGNRPPTFNLLPTPLHNVIYIIT